MTWRGCLECVVLNRSLIIDLYFVMYSTYETWQVSPQLCPPVQYVHDVLEFVHSEFWVIWLKWNRTVNIAVCLFTRVPELWLQPVSVWEQIVLNPVKSSCDSFLGHDPSVQDKSAACVSTLYSVVTPSLRTTTVLFIMPSAVLFPIIRLPVGWQCYCVCQAIFVSTSVLRTSFHFFSCSTTTISKNGQIHRMYWHKYSSQYQILRQLQNASSVFSQQPTWGWHLWLGVKIRKISYRPPCDWLIHSVWIISTPCNQF